MPPILLFVATLVMPLADLQAFVGTWTAQSDQKCAGEPTQNLPVA
jgi:hypothetical protein